MKEKIILKWIKGSKERFREIDRQSFYDLMNSIKVAFQDDNRVSSFFCDIIPRVEWIKINKDNNESRDIPFIEYGIDDETHILEIRRYHKIIWSILEGYTK